MPAPTAGPHRSYRPGAWFGIFGEHATVLLPPSEKERVGSVWAMVDDGAGFDVVLDALISQGLRDLPGFVLVASEDGRTKVVIRGEARAWFTTGEEVTEVAGTQVTTWAERSFSDVTATRLVVGAEVGDGDPLPINGGLVRVSEVVEPARCRSGASQPELPPPPEPRARAGAGAEPEPEPGARAGAGAGASARAAARARRTPGRRHPGRPGGRGRSAARRRGSGVLVRPVARLVFSSGDDVEVDRAVLVGRAPEARRFTSGDQPRLVPVSSPAQEISSTHLEIRPGSGADHGSAVVTDLGSTNGSVLVQPGLPPEDLRPGIAVQLIPGAIIDLGDGVTIQVIDP